MSTLKRDMSDSEGSVLADMRAERDLALCERDELLQAIKLLWQEPSSLRVANKVAMLVRKLEGEKK